MELGIFMYGLFVASEPRKNKDGYYVSIAIGVDSYKVSVPSVPASLAMGSPCALRVRPSAFNERLYYSGEFIEKEV